MAVWLNENQAKKIEKFSFVKSIYWVEENLLGGICEVNTINLKSSSKILLQAQTLHLQGQAFKKAGISGKGVRVAVIDAGFKGLSNSKVLSNIRNAKRILHTYDYISKSTDVEKGSKHGSAVLSCIGGQMPGDTINLGLATDAEFLLYRTEKMLNEKYNEEEYWLAAAEDAEKRGAKVINTSLGYTGRRYFRKDMDGKHSLLSKAARMAAQKGIVVVCSAGNEGTNLWRIIATPADRMPASTSLLFAPARCNATSPARSAACIRVALASMSASRTASTQVMALRVGRFGS
jgi:subtilisin family serine protease